MRTNRKNKKMERIILGALMFSGTMLAAPAWALANNEVPEVKVVSPTDLAAKVTDQTLKKEGLDLTGTKYLYALNPANTPKKLIIDSNDSFVDYPAESSYAAGFNSAGTAAVSGYKLEITRYPMLTYTKAGYLSGGLINDVNGTGAVTGNSLTIYGTTVKQNSSEADGEALAVTGGYSTKGNASENELYVDDGTFSKGDNTVGQITMAGGYSASGDAIKNTAIIRNGTFKISGLFGGETGSGNATENKLIIHNGDIESSGFVAGGSSSGGNATGNTVSIQGGTVASSGGIGAVVGGASDKGNATGNKVEISGGTVNANVFGGLVTTQGNASDNAVTISNEAALGANTMIYGGMTMDGAANNNIVNIMKAITIKHIIGGEGTSASGNTLNVCDKNVIVGSDGIAGIQNYNFYLPSSIQSGDTMLTVNGTAPTDVTGTTFGVVAQQGAALDQGDTIKLLTNPQGLTGDFETQELTTDKTGTGITIYTSTKFKIEKTDENTITATVNGEEVVEANENAKSLLETKAATTTYLNAGGDLLAGQGFTQAAEAVALNIASKSRGNAVTAKNNGFTPFAAFSGSNLRAISGSHVDTKGFGLNVGFAREIANASGKLLFGPVVEYGGGSYKSHLDNGITGEGGAHYLGLGLMARQVTNSGLYYEGSIRAGRVNADYKGCIDGENPLKYDTSSNYFGAHLGIGKVRDIGHGNTMDSYLKYFYTHQGGDNTTIYAVGGVPMEEATKFSAVNSHRLRLGARITHKINERSSYYGGLAYQHEFGGKARATFGVNDSVPSPSTRGGSGMLELGWQVKPGGPVNIDLGVTGWVGKQRGLSMHVGATWNF